MKTKIWYLFLISIFFQVSCSQSEKRPNILFIMADDHTSQAWGIYGGILKDFVKNENIERIARNGAKLKNVFCTNSICVPSRASIMSGQYSHKNGVYTLRDSLDSTRDNIARTLQSAGYRTALFGKWHLKSKPTGFDEFTVLPGQGNYHNPYFKTLENWEKGEEGMIQKQGFSSDVITDMSLDWLSTQNSDEPFFLMCHFKATHEPFDFADRYRHLYDGVEFPEPESLDDWGAGTTKRSFPGHQIDILGERYEKASTGDFWTSYPELPFDTDGLDSIEARKKIYQKFIRDFLRSGAGIDDNIGRLLDYLEDNGLDENTVVIYTSDQGYFLGEHAFFDKRMMLEESLRMPFIIQYPKEIPGGTEYDEMILNIDFPALFADYAEIDKPDYIQGESFRDILSGEEVADWRDKMYYRYWTHSPTRPAHLGIRTGRYKLIYYYGKSIEGEGPIEDLKEPGWDFYDLEEDPAELNNAYDQSKYRKIIARLKSDLQKLKEETGDGDDPF